MCGRGGGHPVCVAGVRAFREARRSLGLGDKSSYMHVVSANCP